MKYRILLPKISNLISGILRSSFAVKVHFTNVDHCVLTVNHKIINDEVSYNVTTSYNNPT